MEINNFICRHILLSYMRAVKENSFSLILLGETAKEGLRMFLDKNEIRKLDNFYPVFEFFS